MKTYEITQDQLNKLANELASFPYRQIYKVFEMLNSLKPMEEHPADPEAGEAV